VLFLAGATPPAGHIERHRDQIADRESLDVAAHVQYLAGDFMAEHQARLGGSPALYHMLIRTADIGRDNAQDDAMPDHPADRVLHFWKRNTLYFDFS
jgi:hypothetical protein